MVPPHLHSVPAATLLSGVAPRALCTESLRFLFPRVLDGLHGLLHLGKCYHLSALPLLL